VADRWPHGGVDPDVVQTNVVLFGHPDTAGLLAHLRAEGVVAGTIAPGVVRLMTHLDIDDEAVERAAKALSSAP
jgi:threonine aldolase